MRAITILLIEDNLPDVRLIREMLKDVSNLKYNLVSVVTLKEGCEQIQKNNFDIILLDLNLPDSTGRQTFQKVIDCNNEIPVILITGMEDVKLSLKLMMEGAQDYITKQSLNPDLLEKSILYSIERQELLNSIKLKNTQIDRIEKERILIAKLPSQNPGPILRVAGNGKLLYINEAGIKLLPDWQLIINEIIPSRLKNIIDPIFIEGTNIKFELVHREFIYSFYAVPLFEEGYINLYGRDITEHKRAEEALRESEERFRKIFEESQVGIIISTLGYRFEKVNPAFCSMMGYTTNELISMTFADITHPDDIGKDIENIKKLELGEIPFYVAEKRYLRKTGEIRWGNITISFIRNKDGAQLYYLGMINDITERKRAEQALLQSKENFHRSISESPLGIRIVSVDGETIYANKAFLDIYEFNSLEEFTSTQAINRYTPESHAQHQERKEKRKKGHDVLNYDISIVRKNAEIRHVKVSRKEILWNGIKHYQLINQDITAQKKLTLDLIEAKEHAQESDRLKSAFLANMSHEIRTPMNGILGFSELLKEPGLTGDQQQEYIRMIEKSGARMLNIINDIVDISKIEAGLMNVNITETYINENIESIYLFFKPQVEGKGMQLLFKNTLPAKEAIIRTDNEKVYSILTNLVKNAIKFSNEGTIEFGYIKRGETLEFYVKDTGIGIPKDRQSAIFERFIQADITDKMARQGAGLGLSISKAYIEMLGGKIWVESEEGIGSTFYFTLPYNAEPEEKKVVPAQNEKNQIKNLKILIAEDDEISEMLISITVKEFSKEVIKARTGNEAIEICRTNPDLDLILMDIQMPDLNGYEATQQIRQFNKVVVIIAQTAFGLSGDREKAIEAGCNDYISKPINKDELLSLIQKYFKK